MTRTPACLLILAAPLAFAVDPPPEPAAVRSLSFSPDGTLLAAAVQAKGEPGRVVVWDVAGRKLVATSEPVGEAPTAAFAPDGKSVVVAGGQKALTVLDPKTARKTGEIGPFTFEAVGLAPAGPGQWVVRGKDHAFRLWDEKAGSVGRAMPVGKEVWAWAVSPGGKWLFANNTGGDFLWDLTTGKEVAVSAKPLPGRVNTPAFLGEDRLLIGSNYGSHRIVELLSGTELLRFRNEGGTGAMEYSPAAGLLAGRYYKSSTVGLTTLTFRPPTDAEKARVVELLKACDSDDYPTREKAAAALVELGPAVEPLLKAASADGPSAEVRMRARVAREAILNKPKFTLTGHDEVRAMAFAPDGKVFATGGSDGVVILWNLATGKELGRLGSR
jgi:WD40 repeat protein